VRPRYQVTVAAHVLARAGCVHRATAAAWPTPATDRIGDAQCGSCHRAPMTATLFDPLLIALCAAILLAGAVGAWRLLARIHKRAARRRAAGYELMDCLKAYTVWTDWHRDEPLLHQNPEELSIPAVLARAVLLKDEHFPQLSGLMVQLLQTHGQLMRFLWEQNILRMTEGSRPCDVDPRYHLLRDQQDAALDSLFMRCREAIGDRQAEWRSTRSDFTFSSNLESSTPVN
jgi:hypothetical protein